MEEPLETQPTPYRRTARAPDALRPLSLQTAVLMHPEGSAEIAFGHTRVLCTASVETTVPAFAEMQGHGWVTAEYAMLPRATNTRGRRTPSGRSREISRLVGRVLRQAVDLEALRGFVVTVDCDVLQADGGTRTAAITGGYVALAQALTGLERAGRVPGSTLREPVAAVSVGLVGGEPLLDLEYEEDHRAEVDLNVAMTAAGRLVEIQGTAERAPFSRPQLERLLDLAQRGIDELMTLQAKALETEAP